MLEEANTVPKKQNVSFTDDDVALRKENAPFPDKNVEPMIAARDRTSFFQENVTPRRDNTEYPQEVVTLKKVSTEMV